MCPRCGKKSTTGTKAQSFCSQCGLPLVGVEAQAKWKSRLGIGLVLIVSVVGLIRFLTFGMRQHLSPTPHEKLDAPFLQIEIANADRLWKAGKKSDAVEGYKTLVNDHLLDLTRSERARVFERIVEFQIRAGGPQAANDYIQKAILFDVPLSFDSPESNRIVAEERLKAKHNGNPWTDNEAAERFIRKGNTAHPN